MAGAGSVKRLVLRAFSLSRAEQKSREEPEQLNAIRGGDKDVLASGKTEHEQLEEKVETGRSEKHASMDEADSASKKAAASAKAEFRKALAEATADELTKDMKGGDILLADRAYVDFSFLHNLIRH